jgi:two-component system OmpR family sensor kinase
VTQTATLGRGLGKSLAIATLVGTLGYAIIHSLVIWITENGEVCQAAGVLEDPPSEIAEQGAIALAFALPIGLAAAIFLARQLTHGTTQRLDEVIASASRMTGEHLDQRIPVSRENDALDQVSIAFNAMLERVETGVAAQKQFAADASHELRTPLAVISTSLEVARRKPREHDHWERVADETLAEVRRMNALVDKLLVLARAGAAGLKHERLDLRVLASAAADRIGVVAKEHEVAIEVAPGSPVEADVDPNAMAIVFDNLLRNAVDHSPRGERIAIAVEASPQPKIVVDDRGPGVPPEMRARVFEPFARGTHSGQTDRSAGTGFGLGLAICKRIITGHNGSIAIDDRPGGGARFVVALPPPASARG